MSQSISKELNDYTLLKQVGQGAQGSIQLVENIHNKQQYIIKTLNKQHNHSHHIKEELSILQTIQHQNIAYCSILRINNVFTIGCNTSRGRVQIHNQLEHHFKQYLQQSKDEQVNQQRHNQANITALSQQHAVFYLIQCVNALQYLHANNILYRDLKPSNIMINSQGYIVLIDLGMSKRVKSKTYTICGTPHYMAPEVINQTGYDSKADYWSLGIVLFEMLTGQVPFNSDDPYKIYQKILNEDIVYPKYIDKQSKRVMQGLTQKSDTIRKIIGIDDKIFSRINYQDIIQQTCAAPYIPKY